MILDPGSWLHNLIGCVPISPFGPVKGSVRVNANSSVARLFFLVNPMEEKKIYCFTTFGQMRWGSSQRDGLKLVNLIQPLLSFLFLQGPSETIVSVLIEEIGSLGSQEARPKSAETHAYPCSIANGDLAVCSLLLGCKATQTKVESRFIELFCMAS